MTPTERKKAARSVGLTPEQLKAAKTAAAMDEAAFSRAADRDFDFYQAAQYDEVKDVPGALDRLGAAAGKDAAEGGGYGHWEHAMASLRQRSQTIKEQADLLSALRADKVTQVDRPYEWRGTKMRELTDLVSGMGRAIDPAQHVKDCPGRAFYLGYSNEVVPVCADWKKNGHQLSPEAAAKAGVPADAEEAKAANRLVRTNNEAFKTATTVRRTALKTALKEKPGDASWALLRRVAREMPEWYAKFVTNPDRRLMAQLLGAPEAVTLESADEKKAAEWLEQAESRMGAASSSKLLLAQVFAAYEARVMNANKVWASPNGVQVELLVFMRDHLGYKLSDIEAEMVAHVEGAPGGVNAGPVAERLADPEAGDGPVGEIEGATAPEGEGSGPDGAGGSAVDGPADASLGDDDAGGTSAAAPDADGEQRVAGAA